MIPQVNKILHPTCVGGSQYGEKKFKGAVYLQGSCFYSSAQKLWTDYGYELVNAIDDSDIVCWLGGSDINPMLYGEREAGAHYYDGAQDQADLKAVYRAGKRFKVGICRGAQLLNCVPNNGSLWQDVDKHNGGCHKVFDLITNESFLVNSIHHQQLILTDKAELISYANESTRKKAEKKAWNIGGNKDEIDVEAAWYSGTKSLLVQWHPELGTADSATYFMNLMERFYLAA